MRNSHLGRYIILAMSLVLSIGIANSFPRTCELTLVSQSPTEVTLISSALNAKPKLAEEMAVKQAFFGLMNTGIEGFHSGHAMLTEPNKAFDYTFYKDGKYRNYITCTPIKADDIKIGNDHKVSVKVCINYAKLKKDLEIAHLSISPAWQDKKEVKPTASLNPTIVVVPAVSSGDQSFQGMKNVMDENPAMKHAVNSVSSMFASHGYKTRDFLTMLANSKTDDVMNEGTQTDAQTMVLQQLPGDIVVTVSLDLIKSGKNGQCTLNLNAVERQTAGKLCSVSYGSGQYMTTDFVALTNHALSKVENKFFDQMKDAFAGMVEKGREVKLEFLLGETVSDWDFDTETPVTDVDFKEELEEWMRSVANHGIYDLPQSNDKFIAASINIPLWDTEKNRSYSINNFNSALRRFMKRHLGDAYKAKITGMGQKLIITIE